MLTYPGAATPANPKELTSQLTRARRKNLPKPLLYNNIGVTKERISLMNVRSSVLKAIMEDIYAAEDFESALAIVKERLDTSEIRESEGRVIYIKAQGSAPSLLKLQQYITNSWFKYEGMAV